MARNSTMMYGLKIMRRAGARTDHTEYPPTGVWVSSYDPNANGGRGEAAFTHNPARAMAFPDQLAAMRCWHQQSTVRPLRPDGKPNRPLTAYTVACELLP